MKYRREERNAEKVKRTGNMGEKFESRKKGSECGEHDRLWRKKLRREIELAYSIQSVKGTETD